jgi:hypothetical protein
MDFEKIVLNETVIADALGDAQVPYAPDDARIPMGPHIIQTRFGKTKKNRRKKRKGRYNKA